MPTTIPAVAPSDNLPGLSVGVGSKGAAVVVSGVLLAGLVPPASVDGGAVTSRAKVGILNELDGMAAGACPREAEVPGVEMLFLVDELLAFGVAFLPSVPSVVINLSTPIRGWADIVDLVE